VIIQDESETIKLNITTDQIWTELLDAPIEARKNTPLNITGQYTSYSHTAMIPKLKSGVHYTYQIFQTNGSNTAGPYTFILPEMSPKDSARPIKFALYADIDTVFTNYTLIALNEMKNQDPNDISFHLFLGDLGYDIFSENGKRGEYFYNSWQKVLATTPFMVTPGNHEIYGNYSFLNMRTRMPLYNQTQNHYYSFNVGKMHILTLNYYFYRDTSAENQQRMFEWIEADLKAANASRGERPWVVIATHQPIYCSFNSMEDQAEKRCYNFYERWVEFEELYFKYRVDMVLQGHVHTWERMGPTYKNASLNYSSWSPDHRKTHLINPEGPVYTIEGAAGNSYFMAPHTPLANYSIASDPTLSYSTLTIVNGSALKYEHINAMSERVMDAFYILKGDEFRALRPFYKTPTFWVLFGALTGLVVLVVVYLKRRANIRKVGALNESMLDKDGKMLEF